MEYPGRDGLLSFCSLQTTAGTVWTLRMTFTSELLHFAIYSHDQIMVLSNYSQSCQIPPENQTMHWQLCLKTTPALIELPHHLFCSEY